MKKPTKAQMVQQIAHNQKVSNDKDIVQRILSVVQEENVQDVADHLDAISALIVEGLKLKTDKLSISDLNLKADFKSDPNPKLSKLILDQISNEKKPEDVQALLAHLSRHIFNLVASRHVREHKISEIDIKKEVIK